MNDFSVMIAMSGGVDSAAAAYLLKARYSVTGVTMQLADGDGAHREAAERDIADAAATCKMLGIPHRVCDLSAQFRTHVTAPFIKAYEAGLTPNPCVLCNKKIKFGALLDFATEAGFSALATGHYARIEQDSAGRYLLRRAKDAAKDQTYMLYSLTQDVLSRVLLPLGELEKSEVRALAGEAGLSAAKREDSQDICFIPDGDYAAYIKAHSDIRPQRGAFISPDGRVLGEHRGLIHYTVGQRKGLGIALGKPAFVLSKSVADNTVTLGDDAALYSTRLKVKGINLIPFDTLKHATVLDAKARYRQTAAPARVEQTGEDELTVEFQAPQRAIAAGQSLVLYDGDYLIGGGIII